MTGIDLMSTSRSTRFWQDGGKAVGPSPASTDRRLQEYDPDTFIYLDKLPDRVIGKLTERNLIKPRHVGRGYVAASAESLTRLLCAYASVLHEDSGGRLVPAIEQPAQARRIAAPSSDNKTCQGLVVMLYSAVTSQDGQELSKSPSLPGRTPSVDCDSWRTDPGAGPSLA